MFNHANRVSTFRFLDAMSAAMELATPTLVQHQRRVAFMVWRMGEVVGWPFEERETLFLAGLIHDLGALTPEERLFNHEMTMSPREIRRHCAFGARLLADSPVLGRLAPLIARHHTPYTAGETLSVHHLLHMAEIVEHHLQPGHYVLAQRDAVLAALRRDAPALAGPEAWEVFVETSRPEAFWLDLASRDLLAFFDVATPFGRRPLGDGDIWSLGDTFRRLIDFRSHFTATHSAGVLTAAGELASRCGFAAHETRWMRFAGAMHDAGKMAVPSAILEKNGPLDDAEMNVMRQHTFHTARILGHAGVERHVVEWAAFHHERLNGEGYPFRMEGESIGLGSRVMAVADIFTALAEDRPYRAGLPRGRVVEILRGMVEGGAVDGRVVSRLEADYDAVRTATMAAQAEAQRHYAADFGSYPDEGEEGAH